MQPLIISFGEFKVYSYPLFIGFAWGLAFQITQFFINKLDIEFKRFKLFTLGLFVVSWVGAKVFFLIFSSMENFRHHLISSYFWLGGGFVFYGGLLAGVLFVIFYCMFVDKTLTGDKLIVLLPALAYGHAIGRIGCLLAGCCYGQETSSFFSIQLHGASRYPVQLYESILLVILGVIVTKLIFKKNNHDLIISFYFIYYAVMRFILEFFRGDQVRGIFFNLLSASQIVSIFILTLVIIYLTRKRIYRR
ncbi:MAG: hypothetical protein A2381_12000 [Bdellovibrionales bacterium RIFOXYB1_FULL_37_110]|nr:MAG: hypothetical protein A2181_01725 [Bdellovibrionales bacterium RIFOXYA1_FULL_38_20]OFZ52220.1 MAG: hypothetical protein A2417_05845 [Bdellovibrionales bacterium RIFOXYC1_FULL_37_79]OFZ57206.1 MAG: hypothetical protein A2381_12000 [Bdellovibrionales bacterium RIFOXYB1_FULL_37_110]OFZ65208.1 MAG: hypothetical protein A2577_04435 [Bdellovibrionales bacterium RIFOXYD1_FULL_36_51]